MTLVLRPIVLSAALAGLAWYPSFSLAQKDASVLPVHHVDYSREFTADQILNADLPGRPPSPPPSDVRFDPTGFAQSRVFHLPLPGIHPRILFGPEDLPGIRSRLATTSSGRQMLAFTRRQIANGIDKPGTWENELYQDLLRGDIAAFSRLYRPEEVPYVAGNSPPNTLLKAATKWHHRDSFGMALEMKAFLCLLDNDRAQGSQLGTALEQYALYYRPRAEKAAAGPFGDNWWRSMRSAVEGWPFLPLAYDIDYNFMTSQQRTSVRQLLSLITKGRYSLGMELPPHWRVWNFIGLSMYEAFFSLAIEGEEGYDPRIYRRTVDMVRDYLAYGVNPSGMAHESVGYHSAGLSHMSFMMIAMANRGDNYFIQNHYREQFDQWFLQTLQPYGQEWFSDGDLGNFPAGTEPVMIAKYFYPDDPKLDYVFQNLPEVRKNNFGTDLYMLEAMMTATDPARDAQGQLVDYEAGAALKLPNTYVDEHRGVLIARDRWSTDALYLNFECHPDTLFASHDHADRGRFVLSALGRNWAWQDSRPHQTAEASSVLIDDAGQGYFPTYAKWLGITDSPQATFAACDASYAYDWMWRKEAGMWPDDDPRLKTPFYTPLRSNVPKLDPAESEYDPSPQVVAFYKDYLAGNPRIWDEDSWVVRQVNNPVRFAFRSAGVVRGPHPYALIIDDLRKDDTDHIYKWLMQLEEDLSIESQDVHDGVRDIVLAEKTGDRRLLVRVLDGEAPSGPALTEHFPTEYKLPGTPARRPTMYRLTLPFRGKEFRGKVLLYPFHQGETLPRVTWNPSSGIAQLTFQGTTDVLTFQVGKDGQTHVSIATNGEKPIKTP